MAKVPTILRGEDTAARGRTLAINLPEGDYTGLSIRLQICGLERSWTMPAASETPAPSGVRLGFDFTAAETAAIPLGTHMGRLGVILADGTGYIISESIRLRVTDDVAEATGADNAISITARDAAAALDLDLDGIEDEPATPDALRAAWKEFLARLRAALAIGGIFLGLTLTARAEGRVVAQTARAGSLPWGAPVVTNVTVEGEFGLGESAVREIVNGAILDITPEGIGAAPIERPGFKGAIEVNGNDGNPYLGLGRQNGHPVTTIFQDKVLIFDDEGDPHEIFFPTRGTDERFALESDIPTTNGLASAEEVAAARLESSLVYQLMMGSNVVAEVTNYNSSVRSPQLRLLQLEEGEYKTVWAETNGLARTLAAAGEYTDAVAATKADRAWGKYTSGLGADAPSNTTWVSTPLTVIAGGYEYARYITTAGEAWVLTSNGMVAGPDTNAYFRVASADGETLFSIEKTDAVLIGVDASGINVSGNTVTIPIDAVSAEAPVCYATDDLTSGTWHDLTSGTLPGWITAAEPSGSAGAWVWTINTTSPRGFFQFRALQEGSTVIRNNALTDLSQGIVIDGVRYRPVVSGSPPTRTITWTEAH